jgi:pimeloyl-ACP methyl ester carboxylesterase
MVECGGLRIAVHVAGKGAPVLLLHGLGSLGGEILSAFAPPGEGAPKGFRLIAPDRPGYGASDPLPDHLDPRDWGLWIGPLLDALGHSRATLVAHSIGAASALNFATRYPGRVEGLLLLAPFCRPSRPGFEPFLRAAVSPVTGPFVRWAICRVAPHLGRQRLARIFAPDPVPDYLADFPYALAAQPGAMMTMGRELWAYNPVMTRVCFRLCRLDAPALVLTGNRDGVALPQRHGKWIASRLPRGEFRELHDVGHMPHHAARAPIIAGLRHLTGHRQENAA